MILSFLLEEVREYLEPKCKDSFTRVYEHQHEDASYVLDHVEVFKPHVSYLSDQHGFYLSVVKFLHDCFISFEV